ncbi:hypothetical protein GJ496_009803 [Pomphorhynchus laevis]|nr:hypothetical protein GJ496_009803 [Pomphorhynchus laevis]
MVSTNSSSNNNSSNVSGGHAVNPSEFNIRVLCRFRPLNDSERRANCSAITKFPHGTDDTVFVSGKVYVFDKVFGPDADQNKVYDEAAREIVGDILNGYNGTIFAYGQTSSGKTHTMEGSLEDESSQGIIPRIVSDIFDHIYAMDTNLQFQIKISYFEIYMDKIRDLLDPNKVNLAVHEDKNRVPYVKGCTERFVASPEEVLCAIEEGKANRHIAVTNMNEHSSRSHSVFLIDVKQENLETDKKLTGKLYLVDLAGSEKVSKTGAEGSVLDEAKNINKSLSALGNVIAALADGTKTHVPYRDSKLTRILQESLGGNARTTVIICCSPASFNECETKSTLYFGQRAKMIKNTVVVNEELTAEEWKRRYDREHERVVRLRGQLAAAERELLRWRSGQSVEEGQQVTLQYADRSSIDEYEDSMFSDYVDDCSLVPPFNRNSSSGDEQQQKYMLASINSAVTADQQSQLSAPDSSSLDYRHNRSGNRLRSTEYHFRNGRRDDSIVGTSITDDERVLIVEKQCDALYRQLDEKDEEINQLDQRLNMIRQQHSEQEEVIAQLRQINDNMQAEQSSIHFENEKSKEEVKELLMALEELAMNYEQKTGELKEQINKDSDMAKNYQHNLEQLEIMRSEFDNYKQCTSYHQKYVDTSFLELATGLKSLTEYLLNSDFNDTIGITAATVNSNYTNALPSASNPSVNVDISPCVGDCDEKNDRDKDHEPTAGTISNGAGESNFFSSNGVDLLTASSLFDREMSTCKLILTRLKVEAKSLKDLFKERNEDISKANAMIDSQKTRLEENNQIIRELNARVSSLKEAKDEADIHLKALQQSVSPTASNCKNLEDQKAVMSADVENDLEEKRKLIDELRERLSLTSATNQNLKEEIDSLRISHTQKTDQIEAFLKDQHRDENARKELAALEQTVSNELKSLYKIRKLFVADLHNRVRCSHVNQTAAVNTSSKAYPCDSDAAKINNDAAFTSASSGSIGNSSNILVNAAGVAINQQINEDKIDSTSMTITDGYGSIVHRHKIEFLEENLKNLTNVYKELVRENAELQLEIPRLEKRLKATYDRLRSLENALKEARESASKDRKKYITEVNRIRDAVRARQLNRRANVPQIVKPIKGGQIPASSATSATTISSCSVTVPSPSSTTTFGSRYC